MRPHGKVDRYCHSQGGSNYDDTRKELDSQQLFVDLSLLICEGRQPELSERGRIQGPHCQSVFGQSQTIGDCCQQSGADAAVAKSSGDGPAAHVCDEANEKCKKAHQIEADVRQLWSRGVPACLTVALLPDECSKQDNCIAEALVLEKWTIQQITKRTRQDKALPGQFLLQAVRSHLHFSQLSAWWIASRGKAPINVVYRVCLPGESETSLPSALCTSSTLDLKNAIATGTPTDLSFEKHQFPLCAAGKNIVVSVTLESLSRSENVPARSCYCIRPSTSASIVSSGVDVALPTSSITSKESQSTLSLSSFQSFSYKVDDDYSNLNKDKEEESLTETDTPESPLDTSRCNSYQSFCDDHSTPTSIGTTNVVSSQQPMYVPLSLPHLVSSISLHGRRENVSATNPLFDATPSSFYLNSKYLKNRLDALKTETTSPSPNMRSLLLTTPVKETALRPARIVDHQSGMNAKPQFFVPSDEEDDIQLIDRLRDGKEQRKDRILESSIIEKDNPPNINVSFSEWIHQTVDGQDIGLEMARIDDVTSDPDEVEESEQEGSVRERPVTRDQFSIRRPLTGKTETQLNSKVCPFGSGRKLKRAPTINAVQFHPKTGLPLSSSPAPMKRNHNSFIYDPCINSVSALKSALYYYDHESGGSSDSDSGWTLCKSAPASTNLLGSFEESALNGRLKPFGTVDGFTLELGASGAFCPSHVTLPVTTLFFNVSEDNAPSPYFGLCSLEKVGRRGYHVPKKGSVQATLFNPQGTVVKMFVVRYDLTDMPPSCQTFVRQRTFFMPSASSLRDAMVNRSWLRYLIHLRYASSSSGKLFLHTDIRMLFSRKSELEAYNFNLVDSGDPNVAKKADTYELRSFTEMPKDPKFSPRKFTRSDKERNYKRE